MPTVEQLLLDIPVEASWFATIDYADSFAFCKINKSCRYMVVGCFNRRYYQANGMPQGLSHAPLTFSARVTHGFNSACGKLWRSFCSGFIDDFVCFANKRNPFSYPPMHLQ